MAKLNIFLLVVIGIGQTACSGFKGNNPEKQSVISGTRIFGDGSGSSSASGVVIQPGGADSGSAGGTVIQPGGTGGVIIQPNTCSTSAETAFENAITSIAAPADLATNTQQHDGQVDCKLSLIRLVSRGVDANNKTLGTDIVNGTASVLAYPAGVGSVGIECGGDYGKNLTVLGSRTENGRYGPLTPNIVTNYLCKYGTDANSCSPLSTGFIAALSWSSDGSSLAKLQTSSQTISNLDSCGVIGLADPLVIDMSASNAEQLNFGLSLSSVIDGVLFDILGLKSSPVANAKVPLAWIRNPDYMFLVLPNDHDQVLGIDELFGNDTRGPDGAFASNGFAALAKYDSNGDGVIDAQDPVFSKLKLWSDLNFDGIAQAAELHSLAEMGIQSIDLIYNPDFSERDKFGNEARYKSVVSKSNGQTKLIFDLWLRVGRY